MKKQAKVYVIAVIEGYEDFSVGDVFATKKDAEDTLKASGWVFDQTHKGVDQYEHPQRYMERRDIIERKVI
jgi:hypothetical protein